VNFWTLIEWNIYILSHQINTISGERNAGGRQYCLRNATFVNIGHVTDVNLLTYIIYNSVCHQTVQLGNEKSRHTFTDYLFIRLSSCVHQLNACTWSHRLGSFKTFAVCRLFICWEPFKTFITTVASPGHLLPYDWSIGLLVVNCCLLINNSGMAYHCHLFVLGTICMSAVCQCASNAKLSALMPVLVNKW